MSSTISVAYKEMPDVEEGVNESGPWARKRYLVAWADRYQFSWDMAGLSNASGSKSWLQGIPYQYPESPNLFARELRIQPAGGMIVGSSPIAFPNAEITVLFGVLDWAALSSQDPFGLQSLGTTAAEQASLLFATQELDFASEFIQLPTTSWSYASDGAKSDTPVHRRMTIITMNITWHRYPLMPMSKISTYADSVNDATFLGCARGTVYFVGCKTVREATADGTWTQKVMMSLKYRAQDWNKVYRPDALTWDTMVDGSSNNPFAYKDFSGLLL